MFRVDLSVHSLSLAGDIHLVYCFGGSRRIYGQGRRLYGPGEYGEQENMLTRRLCGQGGLGQI